MSDLDVRDLTADEATVSVEIVLTGLAAAAGEIVRQINGRAWLALGFASWDEMRQAKYGGAAVIVPDADRPELVVRLRAESLTQRQIAATIGVAVSTVNRDLNSRVEHALPSTITNARGQTRPRTYRKRPPMDTRPGVNKWSRAVQSISKRCPVDELTNDELDELLGAATFLANYCRGVLTTRKGSK